MIYRFVPPTVLLILVNSVVFLGCSASPSADRYVVVDVRQASDVATGPLALTGGDIVIGSEFVEGESLEWIDGHVYASWETEKFACEPLGREDPLLSDVYFEIEDSLGKSCIRYFTTDDKIGTVHVVDSQLRLVSAAAGSPIYVLERPLSLEDGQRFEAQLKDMKFDPGSVDGVIDESTRAALGFYLEYRELEYRFSSPVISAAVFKEIVGRGPSSMEDSF